MADILTTEEIDRLYGDCPLPTTDVTRITRSHIAANAELAGYADWFDGRTMDEIDDTLERLRRELAEAQRSAASWEAEAKRYAQNVDHALAKLDAVKPYMTHKPGCKSLEPWRTCDPPKECDCGYAALADDQPYVHPAEAKLEAALSMRPREDVAVGNWIKHGGHKWLVTRAPDDKIPAYRLCRYDEQERRCTTFIESAALADDQPYATYDLYAHLRRQRDWSERTFGPGPRTGGVIAHIRKELHEIEQAPEDIEEWIDVVILALDGAWRAGASPEEIVGVLVGKQHKNEHRKWPDWRDVPEGEAIEHLADDQPAPDVHDKYSGKPAHEAAGWEPQHGPITDEELEDARVELKPPSTDGDTQPLVAWRMDGEGFEVPSGQPYRIICCDCGLEHHIVLVSQDGRPIGVAAWRAPDGDTPPILDHDCIGNYADPDTGKVYPCPHRDTQEESSGACDLRPDFSFGPQEESSGEGERGGLGLTQPESSQEGSQSEPNSPASPLSPAVAELTGVRDALIHAATTKPNIMGTVELLAWAERLSAIIDAAQEPER